MSRRLTLSAVAAAAALSLTAITPTVGRCSSLRLRTQRYASRCPRSCTRFVTT